MGNYKVEIPGVDLEKFKVLTNREMLELFESMHKGDKHAKERIIEGNYKLVLSILRKYINNKYDINDLFQVGCIGLIKAVDNFDPSYNVMFSTYAVPLILGEIKRYVRDSSTLRITRSIRDLAFHIMKYKDKYISINGIEPSNEEITKNLNISEVELREAYDSLREPMSIYEPIYNDGGDTIYLLDQIGDNGMFSEKKDDLLSLKRSLLNLKKREREILVKRYMYGKTQTELASDYGVSQAQISRIEKSAIKELKKYIQ